MAVKKSKMKRQIEEPKNETFRRAKERRDKLKVKKSD